MKTKITSSAQTPCRARLHQYRPDDPTTSSRQHHQHGAVANKFEYAYFQPTPFTSWNVTLNNFDETIQANNQYLKDVEQIRVEFLGSGIPSAIVVPISQALL